MGRREVTAQKVIAVSLCLSLLLAVPLHISLDRSSTVATNSSTAGVSHGPKSPSSGKVANLTRYVFPPDTNTNLPMRNGHISPINYGSSPAPMGINDMGLRIDNGTLTGFNATTTSVRGSIYLKSVGFPEFDGGNFSVQLNSVLHNVDISGSEYQFWTQNVAVIDVQAGTLRLVDNIWDFNHAVVDHSIIRSGNGSFLDPFVYVDYGPILHFTFPFDLNITTTSCVSNSSDAVMFNYSLYSGAGSHSGSYDTVVVNNTVSNGEPAEYLISGKTLVTSAEAYDVEWILGGPYGGRNADFTDLNGTMNLYTRNASSYVPVNASFNYGVDTGETCAGADITWNSSTAILGAGPSFLHGMWNVSTVQGASHYSVSVSPFNSFAFVGTMVNGTGTDYTWLPLGVNGTCRFNLLPGNYSLQVVLSGHSTCTEQLKAYVNSIVLPVNGTTGVSTPLYAFNSSEVEAISTGGTGSVGNQYSIMNATYGSGTNVSGLFGARNSYGYGVFPIDLIIRNTSSYIHISDSPFQVSLFDTEHISITGTDDAIYMADSTGNLIFNNSNGGPVHLTNSSGNYISGNRYINPGEYSPISLDETFIWINGSRNYVFNNAFLSKDPVVSTSFYPNGTPRTNIFNVPLQDFLHGIFVNGFNLSRGGYLTNITGGNLWEGYTGIGSYNDGHMNAADETPSVGTLFTTTLTLHPMNFYNRGSYLTYMESILAVQMLLPWSSLYMYIPIGTTLDFPSGNYTFHVFPLNVMELYGIRYAYSPTTGRIDAGAHHVFFNVTVEPLNGYLLGIAENGLPAGSTWSIRLQNVPAPALSMNTNSLFLLVANGSYNYTVTPPPGFYASNGTVNITGASSNINVTFLPFFHIHIVVFPHNATLGLDGRITKLTDGYYNTTLKYGNYSLNATAYGYNTLLLNFSINGTASHVLYVNLTSLGGNSGAGPLSGIPPLELILGITAAIGGISAAILVFFRRKRKSL